MRRTAKFGATKLLLISLIALHIASQAGLPPPLQAKAALPTRPPLSLIRAASFGETVLAAQLIALYVQTFDASLGVRGTLQQLNFHALTRWLSAVSALDLDSNYALQLALLYSRVEDPTKKRQMFEFIHAAFLQNPNRRWRPLAEASMLARHELTDLPLALRFAESLERHATGPDVPGWAQQMRVLLLADIGERERAKVVLGALIASGRIGQYHELRLLQERLLEP